MYRLISDKFKQLRKIFIFLFLCPLLFKNSYAGRLDAPSDYLPEITKISFENNDVVFNDRYRLVDGQWERWQSPVFSNKNHKPEKTYRYKESCSLSENVVSDALDGNTSGGYHILKCEKDAIWFATGSYCSEGENQQAILYRYQIQNDRIDEFKNAVPKCNGVVDIVIRGGDAWIATNYPGEYGPYAGEGLIRYNITGKKIVSKVDASRFSGLLLSAMNATEDKDVFWIATERGIDKYYPSTDEIESRYLYLKADTGKHLSFALSNKTLSNEEHWLAFHLVYLPINSITAFKKAWRNSKEKKKTVLPEINELYPFYLEGLENLYSLNDWGNNVTTYKFLSVLDRLSKLKEPGSKFKSFLAGIDIDILPPVLANQVLKYREKHNIQNANIDTEKYFNELTRKYFTPVDPWKRERGIGEALCKLIHKDKERFKKIVNIYTENKVNRKIDGGFFYSCFIQRHHFEHGYMAIPALVAAMEGTITVSQDNPCSVFSHYTKPVFRTPKTLIASLHARVRTRQQSGIASFSYAQCKIASYWLANHKPGIEQILDENYSNSTIRSEAIDVLSEVLQEKFSHLSEWKVWWKKNKNKFEPRKKKYYIDSFNFHLRK